jgi:hypothetical protein
MPFLVNIVRPTINNLEYEAIGVYETFEEAKKAGIKEAGTGQGWTIYIHSINNFGMVIWKGN